jgi:hypothetical protein
MSDVPRREDYYLVKGNRDGALVIVYAGPSATEAEAARYTAQQSGKVVDLTTLHGFEYPPPERNEACRCRLNPVRQTLCPHGHMTECHHPQSCAEAVCSHYLEEEARGDPPPEPQQQTANWLAAAIQPQDTLFDDSPETGDPACLCSRCGQRIRLRDGVAVRMWPEGRDKEYRFHTACLGLNMS